MNAGMVAASTEPATEKIATVSRADS